MPWNLSFYLLMHPEIKWAIDFLDVPIMSLIHINNSQLRLLLVGLCLGASLSSFAQVPAAELKPIERFDGRVQLRIQGDRITVRVVIQNWGINGGQKIDELKIPIRGFLLVQLRGGELATIINQERRERREDEFWTVPTGVPLGLETEDDAASIQTIVIGRDQAAPARSSQSHQDFPRQYRQYARGLLARTVFTAEESESPYVVEIWDFLVGPGVKSDTVSLPGAAVFEVRSGSGSIAIDKEPRQIRIGSTLALDEGRTFDFANSMKDQAIAIRAIIIRSRQK